MRSLMIRLGASVMFCVMLVTWYAIPDSFFVNYSDASSKKFVKKNHEEVVEEKKKSKKSDKGNEQDSRAGKIRDRVKQSVPFVVQAPHAQWDESYYQDACEEASMIMAAAWVEDSGNISKNDAEDQMEAMFQREVKEFGSTIDVSAGDVARFFEKYYSHDGVAYYENATMEDMYKMLSEDQILIVPTNGKKLGNPNFTNGGPDRHMLVVIGYDWDNREFITNDPGTRVGRGYKYKDSTLYNAIRDYETGEKKPIDGVKKNVIAIKK